MRVPRVTATCAVLLALSTLVGCVARTGHVQTSTTSISDFHRLLNEHRYFQAYLSYTEIRPELEKMGEQAGGLEYQRLVTATAGAGEACWVRILKSPAIPLEYKLDLVQQIDETVNLGPPY